MDKTPSSSTGSADPAGSSASTGSSGNTATLSQPDRPQSAKRWWGTRLDRPPRTITPRRLSLALSTLLLVGLAGLFGWLVFRPFEHPRTDFVFATGGDYRVLRAPPIPFVLEDFQSLEPLAPALLTRNGEPGPRILQVLATPRNMDSLYEELPAGEVGGATISILWLSAHGVSDGGEPYLLCRNFDPTNPAVGRYRVDDLLKQVKAGSATVKLVIFDSGRIESDPRLGMLVNEFPRLLAKVVRDTNDPSLWVLASNSSFERSHISPSLQRSVFAHFVAQGLQGAADLDENRTVDIDELARYTIANVSAWVLETTGGLATQTPQLIWSGGEALPESASPILLSVSLFNSGGATSNINSAAPSDGVDGSPSGVTVAGGAESKGPDADPPESRFAGLRGIAADSFETVANEEATPKSLVAQKKRDVRNKAVRKAKDPKLNKPGEADAIEPAQSPADAASDTTSPQPPTDKTTAPQSPTDTTNSPQPPASPGDTPSSPSTNNGNAAGAGKQNGKPANGKTAVADAPADDIAVSAETTASPADDAASLITEGWKLRDRIARRRSGQPQPMDFAPQVWREYEAWLLNVEQQYRAGGIAPKSNLQGWLKETVPPLRDWQVATPVPPEQSAAAALRNYAARFRGHLPTAPKSVTQPHSLALAELLSARGRPLSPALAAAIPQYDHFVRNGNRSEFDAWAAKLPEECDDYLELRLARQLSNIHPLDWSTIRIALATSRLAEQMATSQLCCAAWVRVQVEQADSLRLAGERKLLDGIGRDRQTAAVYTLRQAMTLYRAAWDDLATVDVATDLRNDLMQRLPSYLQWAAYAGHTPDRVAPKHDDLRQMLEQLATLDQLLSKQDPAQLPAVQSLIGTLDALEQRAEAGLQPSVINSLALLPASAGDSWRMQLLLETPLLSSDSRLRLLGALERIDTRQARDRRTAAVPSTLPRARAVTNVDWQRIQHRAELQFKLAQLADAQSDDNATLLLVLQRSYEDVVAATSLNNQTTIDGPETVDPEERLWKTYREFGAIVSRFYSQMPSRFESRLQALSHVSHNGERKHRIARLRGLERDFRLLDPRDSRAADNIRPEPVLAAAEFYDLLLWNQRRLLTALADAPMNDAQFLTDAARNYRDQAAEIRDQPAIAINSQPRVQIAGTTLLDFTTARERTVDLTISLTDGSEKQAAWLVVDYDPELIEIQMPAGVGVVDQQITRNLDASTTVAYPLQPEKHGIAPTFVLQPGRPVPLRFTVRSKSNSAQPTRIIYKLATAAAYVRHEVEVRLPLPETVDLAVRGVSASYAPTESGVMLHAFPNRPTEYQFGLINSTAVDRVVDLDLLSPAKQPTAALPLSAVPAGEVADTLNRLEPLLTLASVKGMRVPAGGEFVPLPFPLPPGVKEAPKVTPKDAANPADAAAPPAAPDPKKPPPIPLPQGMLAVITDRQTKLQTIRRIEIAPQRPRRFVQARVGYNLDSQQLSIRVTPQDRAMIPPEGIRIRAELVGALPRGVKSQLEGELKPPAYEAALFSNLPSDGGGTMTVLVHVDGYPRAFVFNVPLGVSSANLPEADLLDIRMRAPTNGKSFAAPIRTVPIEFQVDAPGIDFSSGAGEIEVGIDSDRDRELRDEAGIILRSDRQASVALAGLMPGGRVTIETTIGDYQLDLPAPALTNAKVELLGRVTGPDRTAWSVPVEIQLDGTAPNVRRVELKPPGTLAVGEKLEAVVYASDELSGVTKVEVALDTTGEGRFTADMKPLPAKADAEGRWLAAPPTAELTPGNYSVLARATDGVGNVSEATVARFRVVTPDEQSAAKLGSIYGNVLYGEQPFADIVIELIAPAAPPAGDAAALAAPIVPGPTKTDARGNFTLSQVPPGKYKIRASGVVRNKDRLAEAEISVDPAPAKPAQVKLLLK